MTQPVLEGLTRLPKSSCTKARGARTCRNTGYQGRIGLFELLPWNNETADAVRRQASAEELTALAVTQGMKTRFADGIRKVALGLTTVAEVERVVGR